MRRISNNLCYYRLLYELSQRELAKLAGISAMTYCNIETNNFEPTLTNALKIAYILDEDILNIFCFDAKKEVKKIKKVKHIKKFKVYEKKVIFKWKLKKFIIALNKK